MNALLRHCREGRLSNTDLDRAVEDVERLLSEATSSSELIARAVELAKGLVHPLYDCLYLALAARRATVLVTADEEFVRRCRAKMPLEAKRLKLLSEFEP